MKRKQKQTLQLVVELTDVYTKGAFPSMNRRARKAKERERMAAVSAEAQTIKYADIIDNITAISRDDAEFAPVYIRESRMLVERMTAGNKELFSRVLEELKREENMLEKR